MTNYEDMKYNELRSEASEKDVDVPSNPSKSDLIQALEDSNPDEVDSEPETSQGSTGNPALDQALNLKPSKDADETLLDHEEESDEEVIEEDVEAENETSTDEAQISDENSDENKEKTGVEVVESPEFDANAAAQFQLGLNRIQRIAGDLLLGIKPAKLKLEDVRDSAPAARDAINLLMPQSLQGDAGKVGALMNLAGPHIEAWQTGLKQVQEEDEEKSGEDEMESIRQEPEESEGYEAGESL